MDPLLSDLEFLEEVMRSLPADHDEEHSGQVATVAAAKAVE